MTNKLKDVKLGEVIVVGVERAKAMLVTSVGREYIYTALGVYRRSDGRQKIGTGNATARTVLGWQTAKQEQVARRRLREIGIDVNDHVDALRAYIALQREFPLSDLPALETFIVPE